MGAPDVAVAISVLVPFAMPLSPQLMQSGAAPMPAMHLREVDVEIQLSPRMNAADAVEAALAAVPSGVPSTNAGYALFEAEFIRRPNEQQSGASQPQDQLKSKRRPSASNDGTNRRLVRALDPDEFPLAVLTGWQFMPNAGNFVFAIKTRETDSSSVFANLRQEQCKMLSMEKLQRRLQTVANDENMALEELRRRHESHRAAILARIEQLQG